MSGLKTFTLSLCTLCCLASTALGLPNEPAERLKIFADCAGRFSALEEHQRLFDGPLSERTAQQIRYFDDIIAALLPDAALPGRKVLAWRIDAKMAQASLLQQATFGTTAPRKARADSLSSQYLQGCSGLLPSA